MLLKKISISECARECNVSRVTIYSYIKKGLVTPRETPGGKKFFTEEDVEKLKKDLKDGI